VERSGWGPGGVNGGRPGGGGGFNAPVGAPDGVGPGPVDVECESLLVRAGQRTAHGKPHRRTGIRTSRYKTRIV
jgi:hypothetical protein